MRTFIAIRCPEALARELAAVQDVIRDFGEFKMVEPGNIHLTLKFLGDVDEIKVREIVHALDSVGQKKFDVSLKGIGAFPNVRRPAVVWAGVETGRKEIEELHNRVDSLLGPMGFGNENRFTAHYTIARARFLKDREGFQKAVEKYSGREFGSFTADGMSLMKSDLVKAGPVYSEIKRFIFA